jgi:hypothetical protein
LTISSITIIIATNTKLLIGCITDLIIRTIFWAPLLIGTIIVSITNSYFFLGTVCFIEAIIFTMVEVYKLFLRGKIKDTSKGLSRYLVGGMSILLQSNLFFKESVLEIKGAQKFFTWLMIILWIAYINLYIIFTFIK